MLKAVDKVEYEDLRQNIQNKEQLVSDVKPEVEDRHC